LREGWESTNPAPTQPKGAEDAKFFPVSDEFYSLLAAPYSPRSILRGQGSCGLGELRFLCFGGTRRAGRGFSIMDSSICAAVITGFEYSAARWMMNF